jgi:hypothetical protein
MEMADRVEEWQRLQAWYGSKTDEELQVHNFRPPIARRGLPFKLRELSEPPGFNPEPNEFDPSELELVVVRRVWEHSPRTRASRMGST